MPPTVLFVCIRNAGRSQIAEALAEVRGKGRIVARSAGSDPAESLHPEVVATLAEIGIDRSQTKPKGLTPDVLAGVDVVVSMGCGDACPHVPGARVVEWDIADPSGLDRSSVRKIRDEIDSHVSALLDDFATPPTRGG